MTSNESTEKGGPKEEDDDAYRKELLIFKAQLCEQACRFEDMVEVMKEMCQLYDDLNVDERNLLSFAYKNVIGSRRASWKSINELLEDSIKVTNNNELSSAKNSAPTSSRKVWETGMQSETEQREQYNPTVIKSFLKEIETELKSYCNEILDILSTRLIPSISAVGESRVFYYKMKGDYTRYLCETCTGLERKEKANESLSAYKTASDRAMIELPPTNSVRLGLMLNFSVFYHEIMKSPERSCRLAKQAFDDAIAELDTLSEESYRDSTVIMQLLRDNLELWENEQSFQQNVTSHDLHQQQTVAPANPI